MILKKCMFFIRRHIVVTLPQLRWYVMEDYYNKHKQSQFFMCITHCIWKNVCGHCENILREKRVREMEHIFSNIPLFIIPLEESDSDSNDEEEDSASEMNEQLYFICFVKNEFILEGIKYIINYHIILNLISYYIHTYFSL